jgi:hypothetical protein
MCHPGLDPAVMCAATTGPRLATLAREGPDVPAIDHVTLDVRESQEPTSGFRGITLSLAGSGSLVDLEGFVWEATSS